MAVKLRLMRIGKTHRPYYRICVFDSRKPRGGAYIENIGHYDPYIVDDKAKVTFKRDRAEYWLSVGAQPSDTVRTFFRQAQVSGLTRAPKKTHKRKTPESAKKKALAKKKAGVKSTRKPRKKAKKAEAAGG